MTVQILLSTYNGEAYLRPLMDSVLAQDCSLVELLVRDDGSHDQTVPILREYEAASSNVLVMPGKNLGIARSFFQLLERSSPQADYLAFCDQDDVWQRDKISRAVEWLQRGSPEIPALYCSRVTLADEDLSVIRVSEAPRRGLSFRNALVESVVWGCTCVINQAARRLLLRESPRQAWVHDRWIYLVVSAFGLVRFDEEPRILHRRHKTNASRIPLALADRWKIQWAHFLKFGRQQRVVKQAQEFHRIYGLALCEEDRQTLERFLGCRKRLWDRLRYAVSCDVYHQSRFGHLMLKSLLALDRIY